MVAQLRAAGWIVISVAADDVELRPEQVEHSTWEPRPANRDVERGERYKAGDLDGSVGAWFAGRWHTRPANDYVRRVKDALRGRTWRTADFRGL